MKINFFAFLHFIFILLRIKILDLTSRFPQLPGGILDGQTALMRRGQQALGEVPLNQVSPAEARRSFQQSFSLLKLVGGKFEKVWSVKDLTVPGPAGGIPCRLYLPGGGTGYPLFVYLHGGGWVLGNLDSADNISRFLCKHVICSVLSVDYRLAPEHPFPAAVEDSLAAVEWAGTHAMELGGDSRRMLVGGDSAGGTLSAVAAQMSRHNGESTLAGQVLFYAATNAVNLNTPSYVEFDGPAYNLPRQDVDWFLEQYTPEPWERRDARVSPLLAEDLRGLPPALVVTAEFDVLRDEGEDYARRMQAAGVKVKLMRCNGMVHGFVSTIGLIKRATMYMEQVAEEIMRMVGE